MNFHIRENTQPGPDCAIERLFCHRTLQYVQLLSEIQYGVAYVWEWACEERYCHLNYRKMSAIICHFEHVSLTNAKVDICISASSFSYCGKNVHVCKFATMSPLNCGSLFDYIRPLNISCVGVWKHHVYLHEWLLFSEVGNSALRSRHVMHTKIRHHLSVAWCPGLTPSHAQLLFWGETFFFCISLLFLLFLLSLSFFFCLSVSLTLCGSYSKSAPSPCSCISWNHVVHVDPFSYYAGECWFWKVYM